ncbi:O-antigen ligase family protein, partial [Candidatus Bipolaricaulota bacterium]|nr:O-antigen ligase family protein [Candidatus Bipolaricaulota bacterium]
TTQRSKRWWILGLACIVAVLCICALSLPINSPAGSASPIVRMWENNSGSERVGLWLIGAEMLVDHPVTGVGVGNYKIDFFPYKANFAATEKGGDFDFPLARVSQAHNEYVQASAEFGSIGVFMLLGILGMLAISLWIRLRENNEKNRLDLLLLTGGILAFLAHSVVSFPVHVVGSSLLFIVVCGLALSPRYGENMTIHWVLSGWKGKAIHIGVVIMALVVSTVAINDLRANWLMERGLDQIQAGFYAAGEGQLQASLALDFAPRQTYYYLAMAQIQMGEFDAAEQNLEACMTSFSDERVYLTYADLKLKRKKLEEAQAAIELLLATPLSADIDVQARYIEAVICVERRQFDQALRLLTSLSQDYPTFEPALVALGQLYAAQGLTFSARTSFETALQLIVDKLAVATSERESATLTERQLIRDEIETLTEQRDHVVSQINNLP